MDNLEKLAKSIILRFGLDEKGTDSYKLNRLLTFIDCFYSPSSLIIEMEKEGLVTFEDSVSAKGVLVNVKTSEAGKKKYIDDILNLEIPSSIAEPYYSLLKQKLGKV